jgi:hypothetical protein
VVIEREFEFLERIERWRIERWRRWRWRRWRPLTPAHPD